jgi:hypothetical protein
MHIDICEPLQTTTQSGYKYFITIINDFSRYITIYLLKHKFEAFDKLKKYKTLVENQLNKKIKI